jgi:hypothetical protein
MTECEIYMTLAMRHIYDSDYARPLKIKDRVKYFASMYKNRKATKSWVFCGHPVTLPFCHFECHGCWEHWMKEFTDNKQDRCNL